MKNNAKHKGNWDVQRRTEAVCRRRRGGTLIGAHVGRLPFSLLDPNSEEDEPGEDTLSMFTGALRELRSDKIRST